LNAILTLGEGFEGEITKENIEIGVVSTTDRKFKILTPDAYCTTNDDQQWHSSPWSWAAIWPCRGSTNSTCFRSRPKPNDGVGSTGQSLL